MNEALAAIAVLHLLAAVGLRGTFHPVVAMEDGVVTMEKRMPEPDARSSTGKPVYASCNEWNLQKDDIFTILDHSRDLGDHFGGYNHTVSFLLCDYSIWIVKDHRLYALYVESTGGFAMSLERAGNFEFYACFDPACRQYFVNEFYGEDVTPWDARIPDPRDK